MSPGIARSVRNGWNPESASWSAAFAGITCPARITIDRGAVGLGANDRFAKSSKNRYASRFRPRLPPDPCTDEEETNVALKITTREVDGVTVAALDGRIVLGEESNALREKVKALVADGKKKIVLNMNNITFIDSAGLGTLVAAHHSAKGQGASLKLCHLGTKFQEVLQITKLMTIFDVYNSEAEAVASFSK
jgi:anti-sigma B factor antagonist